MFVEDGGWDAILVRSGDDYASSDDDVRSNSGEELYQQDDYSESISDSEDSKKRGDSREELIGEDMISEEEEESQSRQ